MNERLSKIKSDFTGFWKSRTKRQKGAGIGLVAGVIIVAALITYFMTRVTYAPLYSNLTTAEVGQIKEQLDSQGVKSEINEGGTSISVPSDQVDTLLVNLASEGYPKTGEIDYSFFSENAGFGMTDNEFNVIKVASVQTELANLMKNIEGVKDAKVMLNMPEQSTFVSDSEKNKDASASIVLNTQPGQEFSEEQIKTLYNLVSKSVPNLSTDNIVITNQYNEYFDLEGGDSSSGVASAGNQLAVKKQIEKDIQRQVQSILTSVMGSGKAIVTVTSDIDFTQENREENLVEPVDKENMSGIEISAQKITETYTGSGDAASGTPEAEASTDDLTSYQEGSTSGSGDYEKTSDTVNKEVNRIKRQIAESPYRVRDLGIQVVVEPPTAEDPTSLEATTQDDIKSMLSSIVRTSIDKNSAGTLTDEELDQKVTVSVQKLNGNESAAPVTQPTIPWWVWVIGGILVVVIALLAIFMIRSRRNTDDEYEEYEEEEYEELEVEDLTDEKDSEGTVRRKQLEKMAKEKPEDFAKLLRSWISED